MTLGSIIHALWIAGMATQGLLAVVLISKKVWRKFPFFTCYSLASCLASVMIYALQKKPVGLFYAYWIGEAVSVVLGFAVVYEIFKHLFSVHGALSKLASLIFRCAIVVFLCVGLVMIFVQTPGSIGNIGKGILVVEQATRIIEVGLLMFLFGCSSAFGLHWKQSAFGIALGLGIFATVELTAVTLRAQVGAQAADILNIVRILAFNISLFIWLGYLLVPERATSAGEIPKRAQLEQWNQAVMELISQ
jgi:hypothetical protein